MVLFYLSWCILSIAICILTGRSHNLWVFSRLWLQIPFFRPFSLHSLCYCLYRIPLSDLLAMLYSAGQENGGIFCGLKTCYFSCYVALSVAAVSSWIKGFCCAALSIAIVPEFGPFTPSFHVPMYSLWPFLITLSFWRTTVLLFCFSDADSIVPRPWFR